MRWWAWTAFGGLLLVGAACGGAEPSRDGGFAPDGRVDPDAGIRDGSGLDATPDQDGGPTDASPRDAGDGGTGPIEAVLDARCPYAERSGLLNLAFGEQQSYLSALIYDRPVPWYGPPTLADAQCRFFRAPDGSGCACGVEEICNFENRCVGLPQGLAAISVELSGASGTQTIAEVDSDSLYGPITLPDPTLGLLLTMNEVQVHLPATAFPAPLSDVTGTLAGGFDAPTALDIAWTAPPGAARVYTLIPINHHVGGATFTDCDLPATAGQLHVDSAMLMPLAVVTGLEFQGIEHVRFAAAQTPLGCVEIRLSRSYFVNL